jgi:hypothetical protein
MAERTNRPEIHAVLGGKRRTFRLTIAGIGELEQLSRAGVASILMRLGMASWYQSDVRETVRLALIGGGLRSNEADGIVTTYVDGEPLADNLQLAIDILQAAVSGVAEMPPGKAMGGGNDSPATSRPSGAPPAPSDSAPAMSAT